MQSHLPIGSSYGQNRSTYPANRNCRGRTCCLPGKSRSVAAFHSLLRMIGYIALELNSKTWLTEAVESVRAAESIGTNYLLMLEEDRIGC
jgi:hypothetical protein